MKTNDDLLRANRHRDNRPYCINCARHVGFRIVVKNDGFTPPNSSDYILCDEVVGVCSRCGEEIYVPLINDINVEGKEAAYQEWKEKQHDFE